MSDSIDIINAFALMTNFVILPALSYGSQLALGALAVTLVYSILRFSNFAQGDSMAFGTMIVILLTGFMIGKGWTITGIPTALLVIPIAIIGTSIYMLTMDRLVYRHYRRIKVKQNIVLITAMKRDKPFTVAGRTFQSRLLVGSGKYKDLEETRLATENSGAEIITVAIRRTNIGQNANEESLLDVISPEKYTILPNTAGCYNAKDAVRTCLLARELLDGHNLVKLEVLGDEKTLYPNIVETIDAAKTLIKEDFDVMVYTSDDPIVAKELEAIGCCAVMPLASLIGSGQGISNPYNIKLIKEQSNVPVLVDAGIGCASDAAKVMELGCDGVLMNSAIANADNPLLMASAMKHAVIAGRESYLAGRMIKKAYSSASSPMENLI